MELWANKAYEKKFQHQPIYKFGYKIAFKFKEIQFWTNRFPIVQIHWFELVMAEISLIKPTLSGRDIFAYSNFLFKNPIFPGYNFEFISLVLFVLIIIAPGSLCIYSISNPGYVSNSNQIIFFQNFKLIFIATNDDVNTQFLKYECKTIHGHRT